MHTTFTVILTPHGVHSHLQTQSQTISDATFTRETSSNFNKFITIMKVTKLSTHVFALKCFPVTLGDHVTFIWKISKTDLLKIPASTVSCKTNRNIYMLTPHSFHFAIESHESPRCFYGEVLAVMHSLLTQLDMTQHLTSQKRTAQKKQVGAQWSGAQIKHRRYVS